MAPLLLLLSPFIFLLGGPAVLSAQGDDSVYSDPEQSFWNSQNLTAAVGNSSLSLGANCSIVLYFQGPDSPVTVYSGVSDSSTACMLSLDNKGTITVWPNDPPVPFHNAASTPTRTGRYVLAAVNSISSIYGPAMFATSGRLAQPEFSIRSIAALRRKKLSATNAQPVRGSAIAPFELESPNGQTILEYGDYRLIAEEHCNLKVVKDDKEETVWETKTRIDCDGKCKCIVKLRDDGDLYVGYRDGKNLMHRLYGSATYSDATAFTMALRYDGDLVIYPIKLWPSLSTASSAQQNIRMVLNKIKG